MNRRIGLAAAVLACGVAAPASGQEMSTVDQAAARVEFPVYEFTQAFDLPLRSIEVADYSEVRACPGAGTTVEILHRKRRRWLFVGSSDDPCGTRPIGDRLRRVRLLGRRPWVYGMCLTAADDCPGRVRDTRRYGLTVRQGSVLVRIEGRGMPLRQVLRAARSVRRVDLARPVVELTNFLSPDGAIWCGFGDGLFGEPDYAFCGTREVNRSGRVLRDGTVQLCDQATGGCIQNWDVSAPRLAEGQTSASNGFSCTAQAGQVTCTLTEGEHAGKGFRIDAASVAAVP